MAEQAYKTIKLKDYTPPAFSVDYIDLQFDLSEAETIVDAKMRLVRESRTGNGDPNLTLFGEDGELQKIELDGIELTEQQYTIDDEKLIIPDVPQAFDLTLRTRIKPQENTQLSGLYRSNGMFCTQCEAHGFRRITYFLDRPDVLTRFTTTIIADKKRYPNLLSNGNLIETQALDGGRHLAKWEDPFKKPSYLFALVAGDLDCLEDSFITCSGRKISLQLFVEKGEVEKSHHAMAALKKAMKWDEETYGREYDLDIFMIVAVSHFNMGAMENKGLNIFNSRYILADPETATDQDYQNIENVVGHEYFHNWTGNRVTCRDWFQLSLKEGLTVFRDQEFSCDLHSRAVKRIDDVQVLRNFQFAEDAGPMAHPVRPEAYIEVNNFYTSTVYNKGAEVIRMMHALLTPAGFRKGMDLYFERHDGQAVTTDDFVKAMEEANQVDLSQFRLWYSQKGTPELDISSDYKADQQTLLLTVKQATPKFPKQKAMHIPLKMALLNPQGNELPIQLAEESQADGTTKVLNITEAEQQFQFVNIHERPVLSLLRDFSAPIKVHADLSDADCLHLLAHDQNGFARWEASQNLASKTMLTLIEDLQQNKALTLPADFIEAYRTMLLHPDVDLALKGRILVLPSEEYLAQQMTVVDVDAIHQVRNFVRKQLAEHLEKDCLNGYKQLLDKGPYSNDSEAIAKRGLKNVCLGYLMRLEKPEYIKLCLEQFSEANNMTDRIVALTGLSHCDCAERESALEAFYEKFSDNDLVMDKWLAIQARSELKNTLDTVKSLMSHSAFSMDNPNKIRALIGAFCQGNHARFHSVTGAGYAFLTEQVLKLNELNPQIAARLLTPFTQWRRYDKPRQAMIHQELEKIAAEKALKKDVYEIVAKSLG